MNTRNDASDLHEAEIPVVLTEFSCGWAGKHEPPAVNEDGEIEIAIGEGYRSNKHLHGQNLYVLEVNADERTALIEMRKYGDLYGSGLWHYLVGVDGAPFVAQVSKQIDTLQEALESLKPAAVKRAEGKGLQVVRQGDWYFFPAGSRTRIKVEWIQHDCAMDDDHVAQDAVFLKTVTYVRGTVRHAQHHTVVLDGWHKAVQNNAIRTGRLARRHGAD